MSSIHRIVLICRIHGGKHTSIPCRDGGQWEPHGTVSLCRPIQPNVFAKLQCQQICLHILCLTSKSHTILAIPSLANLYTNLPKQGLPNELRSQLTKVKSCVKCGDHEVLFKNSPFKPQLRYLKLIIRIIAQNFPSFRIFSQTSEIY